MYDELKSSTIGLARTPVYDGPETAKREPDMMRALGRQQSVIGELQELAKALEMRLVGLLRQEPSSESKGTPEMVKPPLVQALDDNTDRIHGVNVYLSSILNRLEV